MRVNKLDKPASVPGTAACWRASRSGVDAGKLDGGMLWKATGALSVRPSNAMTLWCDGRSGNQRLTCRKVRDSMPTVWVLAVLVKTSLQATGSEVGFQHREHRRRKTTKRTHGFTYAQLIRPAALEHIAYAAGSSSRKTGLLHCACPFMDSCNPCRKGAMRLFGQAVVRNVTMLHFR